MDSGVARVEDCSNILNSWLRGPRMPSRERERGCNFNVGKEGRGKHRKCGFAEEELHLMSLEGALKGSVLQHRTRNLSESLT